MFIIIVALLFIQVWSRKLYKYLYTNSACTSLDFVYFIPREDYCYGLAGNSQNAIHMYNDTHGVEKNLCPSDDNCTTCSYFTPFIVDDCTLGPSSAYYFIVSYTNVPTDIVLYQRTFSTNVCSPDDMYEMVFGYDSTACFEDASPGYNSRWCEGSVIKEITYTDTCGGSIWFAEHDYITPTPCVGGGTVYEQYWCNSTADTEADDETADETTVPEPDDTTAPEPDETTAPEPDETTAPGPEETTAPEPHETTAPTDDTQIISNAEGLFISMFCMIVCVVCGLSVNG